ncbi:reverse transcriptase domain-containing protein [Tanacetum coccineum]
MNPNNNPGPPSMGPPPQNHNGPPGLNFQNLQAPTDGVGDVIVVPPVLASQFELKIKLLNLVTAISFHGFESLNDGEAVSVDDAWLGQTDRSRDDANKHLDKFLTITHSMKQNGVTDDALRLYLFPYSLTHHATAWFDHLLKNSIHTFQEMASKFISKYFPPSIVTKLRNDISNFRQLPDESLFEAWELYKLLIDLCTNHNMLPVTQIDTFYNGLTLRHRDIINVAAGEPF